MKRLEGKIAIVTGCVDGIGAASAARLASEGAQVVLADINRAGVERAAGDIAANGGLATARHVDLADEQSIADLLRSVVETNGRLDVLHNNGADTRVEQMRGDVMIADMDAAVWDRAFTVNTRGTMLMIKHALPAMIASGGGSIINTSSGSALAGDLYVPAYGASKAAINCLTTYVATQYGKQRIRCNSVCPGLIVTPKVQGLISAEDIARISAHILTPYAGIPEDIAAAVAFLASNDARYVTGQIISVDGGYGAHMPDVAEKAAASL